MSKMINTVAHLCKRGRDCTRRYICLNFHNMINYDVDDCNYTEGKLKNIYQSVMTFVVVADSDNVKD